MTMTPQEIIKLLDLKAHPEGGYYRESYRSKAMAGERNCSTAIYYLLEGDQRSRLHRLASDELWHFYAGDPVCVAEIDPEGRTRETILGADLKAGQRFQHAVPARSWFGAYLPRGGFALVGCTVAPGFDFADFELARRDDLLRRFPAAGEIIEKLA